jgi:hypothetical protein
VVVCKVGDIIYYRNGHRWLSYRIKGETKRSWLVDEGRKVNKKTLIMKKSPYSDILFFTESQMTDVIWKRQNVQVIERLVRSSKTSVEKLKKVLEILQGDEKA